MEKVGGRAAALGALHTALPLTWLTRGPCSPCLTCLQPLGSRREELGRGCRGQASLQLPSAFPAGKSALGWLRLPGCQHPACFTADLRGMCVTEEDM